MKNTRRMYLQATAAGIASSALAGCVSPPSANHATGSQRERAPLALADWGSFHVGGRDFVVSGKPIREVRFKPTGQPARVDPNGTYLIGSMYAQYMIPAQKRGQFPLLMWHGGGLTGVTWETTPDGREGWQHYFLRNGWPVYVSDATERGRAGWTMLAEATSGEPVFLTLDNPYERFRIGDGAGSYSRQSTLPGNQFPADRESYRNFSRQNVPRFLTTDELTLESYLALLDRVGPSILVVHSQAGYFGWRAAQERPHLVKAIVLIEPAGIGDINKVAQIRHIPTLVIYGDNIDIDSRWPVLRADGLRFVEAARAAGGKVDVVNLPDRGIRGNSHMVMMDKNSDQVAAIVQQWLASAGLTT